MSDDRIEIKVLDDTINSFVIQLSGRKFPAIVIQGDSLKSMSDLVDDIGERLAHNDIEEAKSMTRELRTLFRARLEIYESTLRKHGISLPYSSAS